MVFSFYDSMRRQAPVCLNSGLSGYLRCSEATFKFSAVQVFQNKTSVLCEGNYPTGVKIQFYIIFDLESVKPFEANKIIFLVSINRG